MTVEESVANLKRTLSRISVISTSEQNAWRVLEALMKVTYVLVKENSSLNSRLDEIETLLSTFMPGSVKQNEKQSTTPRHGTYQGPRHRSW